MITETTASSAPAAPHTALPRSDFFSAAEARVDRWRQLCAVTRAWQARDRARRFGQTRLFARRLHCFGELAPLEAFFAYPGTRLLGAIEEALAERNAGVCVRLVQHVSTALLTGSLPLRSVGLGSDAGGRASGRRPAAAGHAGRQRAQAVLRDARRHAGGPVAVGARATRPEAAAALRRRLRLRSRAGRHLRGRGHRRRSATTTCRRWSSATGSSTARATTCRCCASSCCGTLHGEEASTEPGALATALARAVKRYRPELDVYLLTDRAVEDARRQRRSGAAAAHLPRRRGADGAAPGASSTASTIATRRRSSTTSRSTRSGRSARSTRCRSPAASRCSARTGSGTWATSTAPTCSWPSRRPRPADSTACSSRPATSRRRRT